MDYEILKKEIRLKALIKSESTPWSYYIVECVDESWTCTCPHHVNRAEHCKHIKAVREGEDL